MNELLKLRIELMRVTEELHKSNAKVCELSRLLYERDLKDVEAVHEELLKTEKVETEND